MHIAVLGAAGMIGRKLVARLAADGALDGRPLQRLTLVDVITPEAPEAWTGAIDRHALDLSAAGAAEQVITDEPDVIIHLAAVVSGEAETDQEKGYRVNLDGTRALLEAVRHRNEQTGYRPRLVFSSSIAVFGGRPLPNPIPEGRQLTPLTSYGTQKAIGELLLADYSRRGYLDGVAIRLPTICIRPGKPNAAASGFFSSILREPLVGQPAVLPVPDTVRHWFASPRAAVDFLLRAATLAQSDLGDWPVLSMPGLSVTVGEQIDALREVAGDEAVALITREPDPAIMAIVETWAPALEADRAVDLGFVAETSMAEIIRVHLTDELGRDA